MTRTRLLLAALVGALLNAEATAQIVPVPSIAQPGIDFHVGGRHLQINGFIPTGYPYGVLVPATPTPLGFRQVGPAFLPYGYGFPPIYGAVNQRVNVQVIQPTVVVRSRRESYDLSGIDLDVESPDKIWGSKPGKKDVPSEPVKAPLPAAKEIARPAPKPVEPAAPGPKLAPVPEGQRLINLGAEAFKTGDYNIALLRFRQAALTDPPAPRAIFLQAQADIVIGKYREAAELIRQELARQPNWPTSAFRPRAELYPDAATWNAQRERILAAQKLQPKDADLPFLLGYLSWFDGERDVALDHFQRARNLTVDTQAIDQFLKGAAAKK
ncbi:MAG TPA: tetratricopeptide repeat protein [Gemmataceae bacterium]|nr:tetratricopeptide repeat protein [Gemmataceae bacterium]